MSCGFESCSGFQNTFTPSLTKKQSTMEKNYIYRKDLGEILEELAEEALRHADTMSTLISIRWGRMTVMVNNVESPYETLSETSYDIIDNLDDTTDAMDRIFGDALVALEQLTINKNDKGNNI